MPKGGRRFRLRGILHRIGFTEVWLLRCKLVKNLGISATPRLPSISRSALVRGLAGKERAARRSLIESGSAGGSAGLGRHPAPGSSVALRHRLSTVLLLAAVIRVGGTNAFRHQGLQVPFLYWREDTGRRISVKQLFFKGLSDQR